MNKQLNRESLNENGHGVLPFQSGLINLGNTCYANSVFQCLFADEELCNMVLNPENLVLYQRSENVLVHQFYLFMKACFSSNEGLINTEISSFLAVIWNNSGLFQHGQQSDANEFLLYLLNCFSESFKRALPEVSGTDKRSCLDEYQVGLKQSTVCENGHRTERFDRTMVSINIEGMRTLSECLMDYFNRTIIGRCVCSSNGASHNRNNKECNSFNCTSCRLHVGAYQTLEMTSLPRKLVLHLKRFRFDGREVNINLILSE